MTEHDPRTTFEADQAEAGEEYAKREREAHALQVRNAEAQAAMHEAYAERHRALATLAQASGSAIALLATVATLHGLKRLVTRR